MILAPDGDIDATFLPEEIREHQTPQPEQAVASGYDVSPNGHRFVSLREYEDDYIQRVLAAAGNNKTQAAHLLGIHPTSLLRRLKKLSPD